MAEVIWTFEERALIAALPKRVAIAVVLSGGHNIVQFLEKMKTAKSADQLVGGFGPNPLIQSAIEQFHRPLPSRRLFVQGGDMEEDEPFSLLKLCRTISNECSRVYGLLPRHPRYAEARSYRIWVVRIAETVAKAATEYRMGESIQAAIPEWVLVRIVTETLKVRE